MAPVVLSFTANINGLSAQNLALPPIPGELSRSSAYDTEEPLAPSSSSSKTAMCLILVTYNSASHILLKSAVGGRNIDGAPNRIIASFRSCSTSIPVLIRGNSTLTEGSIFNDLSRFSQNSRSRVEMKLDNATLADGRTAVKVYFPDSVSGRETAVYNLFET